MEYCNVMLFVHLLHHNSEGNIVVSTPLHLFNSFSYNLLFAALDSSYKYNNLINYGVFVYY